MNSDSVPNERDYMRRVAPIIPYVPMCKLLACDQSEPMDVAPVRPSIPQDHLEPACLTEGALVRHKVDHTDHTLRQLDIALAIIYRLLPEDKETGEKCGVSFDSFRTEAGPRAQIAKNGTQYDVSKRRAQSS